MWLRRSWLEFMRSTHTLWNMTVYDGDAVCEVLPASESQVLFQDLPNMEGAWKKEVSSAHKLQFDIMFGDILWETLEPLRIGLDPHDSSSTTSPKTTHIVQVVCLSVIYT